MGEDFDWKWFINNLWERENALGLAGVEGKGGYRNGRYHPYHATNGWDVGPGFDMKYQSDAFKKKAYSEGFTKEELDDSIKARYIKELPFFEQRIVKEGGSPANTSNEVIGGLLDIFHTRNNGLYSDFPNLWNAVASGDYEGMRRESRTGYYEENKPRTPEYWHWDDGRWEFRKNNYFKEPETSQMEVINTPIFDFLEKRDAIQPLNPYPVQTNNNKIAVAKPKKKEYLTESEKRRQQLRKAFEAKQDYTRIMKANNLQNTATPQFISTASLFAKGGWLEPKDAWDRLSIPEKADIIKVGVKHGIFDLQELRKKYNEFKEGGSKEEEEEVNTEKDYINTMERVAEENYKKWGYDNSDEALLHALNDNTYNYRGYYENYPQSAANADTHWSDEFKTVFHPTFSRESIYSGLKSQYNPDGLVGGHWIKDKYIPAPWQIEHKHSIGGPLVDVANYRDENIYGLGDWLKKGLNWLKNSAQVAAIAESPSVMTAAGHRVTREGKAVQDRQNSKDVKQLRQNLANFGEGALGAMTATGDVEAAYNILRHPIQTARALQKGTKTIYQDTKQIFKGISNKVKGEHKFPTKEWTKAGSNYNIADGFPLGSLDDTKKAAELGRQDVLDWQNSEFNKDRWLNYVSKENAERIIAQQNELARTPFDYSMTAEQLTKDINSPTIERGITYGSTKSRPMKKLEIDGHTYMDYNTGTDVRIASDIGSEARKTAVSELMHHTSGNSIGYPDSGDFNVIVGDWLSPVEIKFPQDNTTIIPMGNTWQNFLVKQNNSLLPPESSFSLAVQNAPNDVIEALIKYGETPKNAENIVDRASYMADIQEQIEHLKTVFLSDIRPYIKNPNDAGEIERYITMHPEIIMGDPHLEILVNKLRPGNFKHYAKYFAEALSTLPIINLLSNEKE